MVTTKLAAPSSRRPSLIALVGNIQPETKARKKTRLTITRESAGEYKKNVTDQQLRTQNSRVNSNISSHKSPRSQERKATNHQRTTSKGQRRRPSQRPAVKVKQDSKGVPPPSISQPAGIERKRSHDAQAGAEVDNSQNERLAKQLRRSTHPAVDHSEEDLQTGSELEAEAGKREAVRPSIQSSRLPATRYQLSEANLRIFNGEMNPAADNALVLGQASSWRSIITSEVDTLRSQRCSNTNAFYRHKHLQAVQIHIHAEPPDYIEAAVNLIVNAKLSKQRRAQLSVIAQELSHGCLKNIRAQSGEDDFLDPLHTALKALGLKNLCLREKPSGERSLSQQFSSSCISVRTSWLVSSN
ncbi:hypothetical protein AYO22_07622 [Fonsecaea multimorphosa]|nr:hypothetical protein AYO22_07622 [Fonsecaea multimorphosa]